MDNLFITVSIPQHENDIDIYETVRLALASHGFQELDISIEYETNSIRYRFSNGEIDDEII